VIERDASTHTCCEAIFAQYNSRPNQAAQASHSLARILICGSRDASSARRRARQALSAAWGRTDTTPPGGMDFGMAIGGCWVCNERESRSARTVLNSDKCCRHSPLTCVADKEADAGDVSGRSVTHAEHRHCSSRNSWNRDSSAKSAERDKNEMWLHLQLLQLHRCLMASLREVRMGLKGVATRLLRCSAESDFQ
jgi:hypothetical protein